MSPVTNSPSGGAPGTIQSPGTAKNVITVGLSENVRGSETDGCGLRAQDADNAQDVVFFSGFGPVQDGRSKPDLVAPGSHMQGLRVPGSYIDQNNPLGVLSDRYFRGSGTSEATAFTSGAVGASVAKVPRSAARSEPAASIRAR